MSTFWSVPSREYELALLQFADKELFKKGFVISGEQVEVCSGAGAITVTAIIKYENTDYGIYLHDGPKRRSGDAGPIICAVSLLPEMKNAFDLRKFILSHEYDFQKILKLDDCLKIKIEECIGHVYESIYRDKIEDIYRHHLSDATAIIRKKLRKPASMLIDLTG